jgi:hypothetical protein
VKRRSSPAGRLPDRARGPAQPGDPERGSALVIAVLVSVILVLLGISFLLMGETENRIARNEKRMAQALYVAEAGTRAVKRWFDRPGTAVGFPPPSVVQRDLRRIVDETDPNDPAKATLADGAIGSLPYYKQGIDLDSDGVEDLFDRPYRPGSQHALMGTPDRPGSTSSPSTWSATSPASRAASTPASIASTSSRRPTSRSAPTGAATAWPRCGWWRGSTFPIPPATVSWRKARSSR